MSNHVWMEDCGVSWTCFCSVAFGVQLDEALAEKNIASLNRHKESLWIRDVYTPLKFHVDLRSHKIANMRKEIPFPKPHHFLHISFPLPFFDLLKFPEHHFNITSYEILTIETPDFAQVNNSLAAMKKAGSGYVKARDIDILVETLREFNGSTCRLFSGHCSPQSTEMAITNTHGSMKRIYFGI